MKLIGFIAVITLGLLSAAFAQDSAQGTQPERGERPPVERQIKGTAGQDIRWMVLTNIKPDCTTGPLPAVRMVTPPSNGRIAVRRVRLNATNVNQCLSVEASALVGLYRSAPEFEGNDTVIVEIVPAEGPAQVQRITISVAKKPVPGHSI